MTGQRFGLLKVVRFEKFDKWGAAIFLCRCDCGKEKLILGASLRSGNTRSCGCLAGRKDGKNNFDEYHRKNPGDLRKRDKRLHNIWVGIRYRCLNTKSKVYKDYGGRGIKICKEWDDFFAFQEWSFLNGYSENLSIDRIDNNGDYSPENCRWVTMKVQGQNRRNSRLLTYHGETHTYSEWSEKTGVGWKTIEDRVRRNVPEEQLFAKTNKK